MTISRTHFTADVGAQYSSLLLTEEEKNSKKLKTTRQKAHNYGTKRTHTSLLTFCLKTIFKKEKRQ